MKFSPIHGTLYPCLKQNKKHQIRHKPGISKHYSTMRNFYNLVCLEQWYFSLVWLPTCETYKSFVGDFFPFLSLNWLDLNFWFIAVIRWDTTWSLKFLWWLNFADIGEIIRKKNDVVRLEDTNFPYCSWIYSTIPRIRTYSLHFSWFFQVS